MKCKPLNASSPYRVAYIDRNKHVGRHLALARQRIAHDAREPLEVLIAAADRLPVHKDGANVNVQCERRRRARLNADAGGRGRDRV